MQEVLIGRRRTALALALAVLAFPSGALDLGEIEVLSTLGQNFDARIPLKTREGEWFHATCLAIAPAAAGGGLPGIATGSLSVERRRDSSNLRVRTATVVNDPAFAFDITSTCAGTPAPLGSGFTVLLDPPGTVRPKSRREVAAPVPAKPPRQASAAPRPAEPRATPAPTASSPTPVAAVPAPAAAPAEPKPVASARRPGGEFVLKLTDSPIDVARTRQFDDKSRALLRERLRLLDNDDQVAAMLAMRDKLTRLEARVSELQLKLASAPASLATATPVTRPEPVTAPPKVEATPKPEPAPAKVEPTVPKVEATPRPEPAPPKVEAAAAKAEAPPKIEAPAPKVGATTPPAQPKPAPIVPAKAEAVIDALDSLSGRVIAAAIALLVLLAMLAGWLWTRWRQPAAIAEADVEDGEATVLMDADSPPMESALSQEQPIELAPPEVAPSSRPELASDAALATRLEEDTELLRRRYIEERFPEIRNGAIVLDDPASVVKGARLFYEDGAIPKAVELLSFAIEDRPTQLRPWLALFEIYRLERLAGEYAELAGRFAERHAATEQWPKVRAFGREIDPSNPLYQEAPMKSLETIGPREARRIAAAAVDPVTENWLEAPMDFENEVLATELRRSLMTRAAVEERDLVPNPMPALRSVEMFSVG